MSNSNARKQAKEKPRGFVSKPGLLKFKEKFFDPFKNQMDPAAKERECVDGYYYDTAIKENEKIILEEEMEKTYFLYDYSKNFIVFFGNHSIRIYDSKGVLLRDIAFTSREKIISVSFNETNQYLFLVSRVSAYLFEINKTHCAQLPREEKENFVGAFFIDNQVILLENEQVLCILYTNHFVITELNLSKETKKGIYSRKNIFSKTIKVDNYFFNQTYYILIIQSNNQFRLFNLKNTTVVRQEIKLQISNVTDKSKFYLDLIYGKLYFIHVAQEGVHLYLLNQLTQTTVLRPIDFDKGIDSRQVKIQLCDNLLLCYMPNNIGIYDIKQKNNKYIGVFDYENCEPYDTIKQGQIAFYHNILFTNGRFFKLNFFKDFFYQNSSFSTKDTFYVLFHRKNCKKIISQAIQKLIVQFSVSNFNSIFTKVVKHLDKKQLHKKIQYGTGQKIFNPLLKVSDDYENDGSVIFFVKLPPFQHIITQDQLFSLFDTEDISSALAPEKIIKLMMIIIELLTLKHIAVGESFHRVFIKQVNRIHSFAFIDCLIKAKAVSPTVNLGKCLISLGLTGKNIIGKVIDRANCVLVFNLGLHVLMRMKEYTEIFSILMMHDQFNQAIEVKSMFKLKSDNLLPELEHKIKELCENEENCFVMQQFLQNK